MSRPCTKIGTPSRLVIGGWFGGKPTPRGSWLMSGMRKLWPARNITPSRPWPRGGAPIASRSVGEMPDVGKRTM